MRGRRRGFTDDGDDDDGVGNAGTAHTIVLSYPETDSIENLGGGLYRRIGKVIVTDRYGKALPDGTQIRLEVIDSIIAKGVIGDDAGDSVNGTSLSDDSPMLADDTATTFTEAAIQRTTGSGDWRRIQADDAVLFFDFVSGVDKRRFIAAAPSATNSLTVTSSYSGSYPSETYPKASYIVGASLLGASVAGVDADGNPTPGIATMDGGTATFYVTYPANADTILTGCGISEIDKRSKPLGSARVYLIAQTDSGTGTVMTIDDRFCFAAIAGLSLTATPTAINYDQDVTLELKDGGDEIPLPFMEVKAHVKIEKSSGSLNVTAQDCITGTDGTCTSSITVSGGTGGDAATITYVAGDAQTTVTVTIP